MQVPMETLVIDLLKPENQNVDKATGISALQFEPSIGTRFMCGLENVLSFRCCNIRKSQRQDTQ